jgi:hypothetical protein
LVWFGEVSVTEPRWSVIEPAAIPFAPSFIICLDSTHNGREINIAYSFVNNVYSARCFKQISKVGKVGEVGKVGKVGKVGMVGKVGKEGRLRE